MDTRRPPRGWREVRFSFDAFVWMQWRKHKKWLRKKQELAKARKI